MVLDDLFSEKRTSERKLNREMVRSLDTQLASPIDRLAANIADLVVFLPMLALVMAPFTRQAKEAVILGTDEAWLAAVVSAVFAGFILLILFQTFFVAVYGGTPGKLVFRMRVVSVWSLGRPRPIEAFIRALVWSGELAVLGAPFLGVFSNLKRRPFHDRASDTAVIALNRKRQTGLSTLPEMSVASGFQSAVLAVAAVIIVVNLVEYRKHHGSLQSAILSREESGRLCPAVRDALNDNGVSGKRTASLNDRLNVAITLFAAGELNTNCLNEESELAFWRHRETPLSYLAKGLAIADREPKRASNYFSKSCETEAGDKKEPGPVCAAAILAHPTLATLGVEDELDFDDEDSSIQEKLLSSKIEANLDHALGAVKAASPSYLKVLAIRQLLSRDTQPSSMFRILGLVDAFDDARPPGNFISQARIQALFHLGREMEATAVLQSSSDYADAQGRIELTRWLCTAETEMGKCSEHARSACGAFIEKLEASRAMFDSQLKKSEVAVAYIRGSLCAESKNFDELKEKIPVADGKKLVEALSNMNGKKEEVARELLMAIVEENRDVGDAYFIEANLRLLDLVRSSAHLSEILSSWQELEPTDPGFKTLGRRLLVQMNKLKIWHEAIPVGLKLAKLDAGDRIVLENLAIAANGAGQRKFASGIIESVQKLQMQKNLRTVKNLKNLESLGELEISNLGGSGVFARKPATSDPITLESKDK